MPQTGEPATCWTVGHAFPEVTPKLFVEKNKRAVCRVAVWLYLKNCVKRSSNEQPLHCTHEIDLIILLWYGVGFVGITTTITQIVLDFQYM